jgi:hypothetical protein
MVLLLNSSGILRIVFTLDKIFLLYIFNLIFLLIGGVWNLDYILKILIFLSFKLIFLYFFIILMC